MFKYIFAFIAILLAGFALYSPSSAKNDKITIVTTTAQIADIVKNIKDDDIIVKNLIGTGVDPHLYRPTRSDVVKLKNADIVFYNGFHLEGQMVELFQKLRETKPVIGLADHLPRYMVITNDSDKYDPHVWMNVHVWITAAHTIEKTLSEHNPQKADIYKKNAKLYRDKLEKLDTYIKSVINTIPENARILVTAHDAFGYFGKAYGIDVIGIQGLSTESEAGLKHMEDLARMLSKKKIPAIFAESSVSERNIRALIDGAKSRGHTNITLGGHLYSDAMGPDNTYEGTYIGMMEHNISTIAGALGGTPRPFTYNFKRADEGQNSAHDHLSQQGAP